MKEMLSQKQVSRRRFLNLALSAGATAASALVLGKTAWETDLKYEFQNDQNRLNDSLDVVSNSFSPPIINPGSIHNVAGEDNDGKTQENLQQRKDAYNHWVNVLWWTESIAAITIMYSLFKDQSYEEQGYK